MREIWIALYSIGLIQGIFLIIALLSLKEKSRYSIGLLVLLSVCPLTLLLPFTINALLPDNNLSMFFRGGTAIPFLIGPLLMLYTFSVLHPGQGFKKKHLFYFIPFITFVIFPIQSWGIESQIPSSGIPFHMVVFGWLKGLHSLVYLAMIWLYVRKVIGSGAQKMKLKAQANWIYWLVIIQFTGLVVVYTALTIEYLNPAWELKTDSVGSLFFSFTYFTFAFLLVRSPDILIPGDTKAVNLKRYKTSSLSDQEKHRILNQLERLLKEEKPYLQSDLKIGELAGQLEVNSNTLSQVINELLHINFNQLLNKYRVEAVKQNILDEKRTLYGIALDHGFKSKSAFNRIFKEMTGLTPSGYKRSLHK